MILKMVFFLEYKHTIYIKRAFLKCYMAAETLPTIKKDELINKKNFAAIALYINNKTFIMHIAFIKIILIYPTQKTRIFLLLVNMAFIIILLNMPIIIISFYLILQ